MPYAESVSFVAKSQHNKIIFFYGNAVGLETGEISGRLARRIKLFACAGLDIYGVFAPDANDGRPP